jgi:hypothetical protein
MAVGRDVPDVRRRLSASTAAGLTVHDTHLTATLNTTIACSSATEAVMA